MRNARTMDHYKKNPVNEREKEKTEKNERKNLIFCCSNSKDFIGNK